ncbi:polysaccharide deacetylase family protein [Winogradskyella sediminis]|uniref:polysaccharide deacetylase family protein n=1 Tax=Winogradskyella sediminis TaxID=1382466 RepID=UPI003AA7FA7C
MMKIIPAKTPDFVKTLFPSFIWNIDTNNKVLYLTFDDGPTPDITDWVISTLQEYNAKATFFCIGKNIKKHPKLFQQIMANGHSIGNHTYSHLKGWKTKTKAYIESVEKTQQLIDTIFHNHYPKNIDRNSNQASGSNVKLFRPPYGKFKPKQSSKLQGLDYQIILWDVLSYDWDTSVSAKTCLKNITSSAKEGSIIVFHDSVKASRNLKYALPKVLKHYSEMGFRFKGLNVSKITYK